MSLSEYEDFVYGACFADRDYPAVEWRALSDRQQKLVDWLEGKKKIGVLGPNIDMSMSIEG